MGKNSNYHSLVYRLSKYEDIITSFLDYFDSEQLLLIPTEQLKLKPQQVINEVMAHIGGEQKDIGNEVLVSNANQENSKYQNISLKSACALEKYFKSTKIYLEKHV